MPNDPSRPRRGVLRQLWFWVLIAIVAGTAFGLLLPDQARDAKWLADAFLQLVKTITAPVIFLTVVVGIASLGSLARAGGLAARALGYFFVATVVALALGLLDPDAAPADDVGTRRRRRGGPAAQTGSQRAAEPVPA